MFNTEAMLFGPSFRKFPLQQLLAVLPDRLTCLAAAGRQARYCGVQTLFKQSQPSRNRIRRVLILFAQATHIRAA